MSFKLSFPSRCAVSSSLGCFLYGKHVSALQLLFPPWCVALIFNSSMSSIVGPPSFDNEAYGDTHSEKGGPGRLPAQPVGDGTHKLKLLLQGEKICCFQNSQGRRRISCTGTTSLKKQPRKKPIHLYSISLHLPQFQKQSAGPTPLWSLWARTKPFFLTAINS